MVRRKRPGQSSTHEVRAGSTLGGSTLLGATADRAGGASALDEQDNRPPTIVFAPEWAKELPLSGGEQVERLQLPDPLVARLKQWNRLWGEAFDEVTGQWPDESVGLAWLADAHVLIDAVRQYAAPLGLDVAVDPFLYECAP